MDKSLRNTEDHPKIGRCDFLSRYQCAEALRAIGLRISATTLATQASRGGGPPYFRFGRAVLYRWDDVLKWAEGRLCGPFSNTAEFNFAPIVPRDPKAGKSKSG